MARNYTFETSTVDGSTYLVGEPIADDSGTVRLSTTWVTDDEVEGEWTEAVRMVLDAELFDAVTVGAGTARVPRSKAADAIAEGLEGVTSGQQANALVAYLETVGVWTLDNGDVVALKDPRDASLSGREALCWAVALDVCAARIDEFMDELDTRANRVETLDAEQDRFEARVYAVTSEMRELGRGSRFPADPSKLDGEERERYAALHTLLEDLVGSETGSRELGDTRNLLQSAREALSRRASEIRVRAIQQRVFPDDARPVAGHLESVVVALSSDGVVDATDLLEDTVLTFGGVGQSTDVTSAVGNLEESTEAMSSTGDVDESVETTSASEFAEMVEDEVLDMDLEESIEELNDKEDANDGGNRDD